MMARPTKDKAMLRLKIALDAIAELKDLNIEVRPISTAGRVKVAEYPLEFDKWYRDTKIAIVDLFGEEFPHVEEFKRLKKYLDPAPIEQTYRNISSDDFVHDRTREYTRMLDAADSVLTSMIEHIEEYWVDEHQEPTGSSTQDGERLISTEVFVVRGRDEGSTDTVARFLEKLGLQPIVLAEQPSQGLTIIEKFERHAQVSFAVVLLTPDDTGSLRGADNTPNPRARQNVIFELGFFIGQLGRDRVCALTKGVVEIPSDYAGVLYIPLDESEGWKLPLVRELRKAGLPVDANQAI